MSGPSRTLKLTYLAETGRFSKSTQGAGKEVETLGQRVGKVGKRLAAGFAVIGAAGIAMGKKLFDAFETVSTANARIETIVDSMGNFEGQIGQVTDRLVKQAEATAMLTGVDRNLIKESQALLLTFDSVNKTADEAGGIFDRATDAAIDLAEAGFGSATGNAQSLGRALEDPIRGLTSLTRQGVTFTEEQQDLIKSLVESNQTLEAQDLILQAIEKQVGGTAEATANGSDRIRQSFGILTEQIAQALAPEFEKLVDIALKFVDRFATWWNDNGDEVIERFRNLGRRVGEAAGRGQELVEQFIDRFRERTPGLEEDVDEVRKAFGSLKDTLDRVFGGTDGAAADKLVELFADAAAIQFEFVRVKILEAVESLERIIHFFGELPNAVRIAGNGITSGINSIIRQLNRVIDTANFAAAALALLPTFPSLPSIPRVPLLDEDPFDTRDPIPFDRRAGRPDLDPGSFERNRGNTFNITIEGAVDSEGTARQIRRIVDTSTTRVGSIASSTRFVGAL